MNAPSRFSPAPISLSAALLFVLATMPLAAQTALRATEPDTLGLPSDTVRLPVERLRPPGDCAIPGHAAVVKDRKDLRRLRRYPQCAKVEFPSLAGRTLVGLSVWGDCNSWFRIEAFRSEKRREYRVRLWNHGGGCRGMAPRYEWLSLPALPPDWEVRFTHSSVPEDAPLDPREWTPIRSGANR